MTVPELKPKPWSCSYAEMGFINSDVDDDGQIKPDAPADQLYHLGKDISEAKNLTRAEPERAKAMAARLKELIRHPATPAAKAIAQ